MSKEIDVDEEMLRISRKTRGNILKLEMSFENQLKQLDLDIKNSMSDKEKLFDDSNKIRSEYVQTDFTDSSLERYREKLRKI